MYNIGGSFCRGINNKQQGGVSHCDLAIYFLKHHLKAKEEFMRIQIFSPCKNIIFKKSSKKKPKSFKILELYN
jgi:hypothetical protein